MKRREFLRGATASTLICACGEHALAQNRVSFCGFVDPPPPAYGDGATIRSYGLKERARRNPSLSWSYDAAKFPVNDASGKALPNVTATLAKAFSIWKAAAPKLTFTNVTGAADVVFSTAALGTTGGGTILASTALDGSTIKFSNTMAFSPSAAGVANVYNLLNVATHEIGHALGLLHATTPNSMMFATTGFGAAATETLALGDKLAINALFGWEKQSGPVFDTETSPAICACGDTLVMVWRGAGSNHNLWISTSTNGTNWAPQRQFGDVGTISSPGLAWDGRRLWMVWRGVNDDQNLYYKTSTDFFIKDNPAQQSIPNRASTHGPRIAIIAGTPTIVWKGFKDDRNIYFAQFQNGQWGPQKPIPNIATEASPAICEDLDGGARLLWRGFHDDQQLYTTSSPRSSVSNFAPQSVVTWTVPGNGPKGAATSGTASSSAGPAIVLASGSVIQAAWFGPKGDTRVWFTNLTKDDTIGGKSVFQWSSHTDIPGAVSSDGPSIAFFKGKPHVAWKGKNDKGIYGNNA